MPSLHDILIWGYIVLSVAGFCYAVGCIRGFFRIAIHRAPGVNPFKAGLCGLFLPGLLNTRGFFYRSNLIGSIQMGLLCALGLVLIVVIGIVSQSQ
ncbi:MAG: hypothetical protein AAF402_14600 [Pseudomonadota bacterium]